MVASAQLGVVEGQSGVSSACGSHPEQAMTLSGDITPHAYHGGIGGFSTLLELTADDEVEAVGGMASNIVYNGGMHGLIGCSTLLCCSLRFNFLRDLLVSVAPALPQARSTA